MAKRKCPRNTRQDGVCGCPSFWKRSKVISTPNTKDMATPSTKSSSITFIIENEREDGSDLHHRKRQKREDSIFPQAGDIGLSSSKSSTYMDSKFVVREHAGQKQLVAQMNTRARKSGPLKKTTKAKANKPVRILVDYDLPTGAERLDWDTDEVRRMVSEIA